jgi:asparagine synthetase B (glutamine-hydrolysing)
MAGLLGVFRPGGLTSADHSLVKESARMLDYSGRSQHDLWSDDFLTICRVHHVHQPPPRPAIRAARGLCLILDGELFDVDGDEEPSRHAEPAERCLDLYLRAGTAGFARLNGHFSLLIYDLSACVLTIASDRFAARPMYYHAAGGSLAFASQVKPLLGRDFKRRPDLSAVAQYFAWETVLDEATFLEGIRTLPPASVLTAPAETRTSSRYWTMTYEPDYGEPERRHAERLGEALRGAIRRQTRDTDGLALLLSGGMDSRAIVALSASPLTAVTLADFENTEVRVARAVAATRSLPLIFLPRPADFYGDLIDLGVELGDGAYRFDNAHFARLSGLLPEGITSVVSGFGFDTLIKGLALPKRLRHVLGWGVNKHDLHPLPEGLSPGAFADEILARGPLALGEESPALRIFHPGLRVAMRDRLRAAMEGVLAYTAPHTPTALQWYESLRMNMMATRVPQFLNVLSIRHFFRDRTPAFDNAILDEYLRIPPRLRNDSHIYRRALALVAPEMLAIADANTGLPPDTHYLVEHLHHRARLLAERLGVRRTPPLADPTFTERSWPNMGELIRCRPPIHRRIVEVIADPAALPPDLFHAETLRGMLGAHLDRRADHTYLLLLVLTFGLWFRRTFASGTAEA